MKNFTLTFTMDQLKVINDALMNAPYGVAAPVVNSINAQIQAAFNSRADENAPNGSSDLAA